MKEETIEELQVFDLKVRLKHCKRQMERTLTKNARFRNKCGNISLYIHKRDIYVFICDIT